MNKPVVLVTGGSRGIGAAAAALFAARGWQICIGFNNSRDAAEALERRLAQSGADVMTFRADVSDSNQAAALITACETRFGRLDALVCCAGTAEQRLFTDITDAQWRDMMAVHADGAFYCCRSALDGMIRRKSGAIVLVSSVWGRVGGSCEVHYSAAKAAVIGMTRALAKEVAPSGIRVNCVAPGVIDTDMTANLDGDSRAALAEEIPMGRTGTAAETAEAIVFLASSGAGYITGQVLGVDGGFCI